MIICKDGTLSELSEKNLNAKLDILFKKNLYDVAVGIAKWSPEGESHLKGIHAKYGDYLYSKGDFDSAIEQYKETIGMLEPSYVIKRFREESRLKQLCRYLEVLHDSKKHNMHHTEILIQCYARLSDTKKLLSFIEKMKEYPDSDMMVAFQALRDSKLSTEASILATKLQLHEQALSTMVDDLHNYQIAVKYISKLQAHTAATYIERYGRRLFKHCPDQLTNVIISVLENSSEEEVDSAKLVTPFIHSLAVNTDFVKFALNKGSERKQLIDVLLEQRLRNANLDNLSSEEHQVLSALSECLSIERALQLARIFGCKEIEEELLIRSDRKDELLHFYMKNNKLREVLEICKDSRNSSQWLSVLSFISKIEGEVDEDLVREMLGSVEKAQCVHPLVVLEILSRSNTLKVSAVKDYVMNWLKRQQAQMDSDRKAVEENEKKIIEMTKQTEMLKFNPQTIQVSKCCACDRQLQIPAVHFLCKHSYHVACFDSYSDKPDSCPACVKQQGKTMEEPLERVNEREAYKKFQNELNESVNCMDLISKYLKMGIFDQVARPQKPRTATTDSAPVMGRRKTISHSANPFEEDDQLSKVRSTTTMSTSAQPSNPITSIARPRAPKNPFETEDYDESLNPFGGHLNRKTKLTNPFDE